MVQCPDTKLCVSGYSQGSQIVHNAAEILEADDAATNFINSVVTFGDPDHKLPIGDVPTNKVSIVCHKGDDICLNEATIKEPHLSYCHNVGVEAAFVKARSQS
jgi:cutinase